MGIGPSFDYEAIFDLDQTNFEKFFVRHRPFSSSVAIVKVAKYLLRQPSDRSEDLKRMLGEPINLYAFREICDLILKAGRRKYVLAVLETKVSKDFLEYFTGELSVKSKKYVQSMFKHIPSEKFAEFMNGHYDFYRKKFCKEIPYDEIKSFEPDYYTNLHTFFGNDLDKYKIQCILHLNHDKIKGFRKILFKPENLHFIADLDEKYFAKFLEIATDREIVTLRIEHPELFEGRYSDDIDSFCSDSIDSSGSSADVSFCSEITSSSE